MSYWRFANVVATAVIGIGGAYLIWSAPDAPRWTVALSGVLAIMGAAAVVVLLTYLGIVIVDDVRPAFRFRKPVSPMYLARRNASLVGRKSYSLHPISFWGGMFLNNRFALVFMTFNQPEHIDFEDDAEA